MFWKAILKSVLCGNLHMFLCYILWQCSRKLEYLETNHIIKWKRQKRELIIKDWASAAAAAAASVFFNSAWKHQSRLSTCEGNLIVIWQYPADTSEVQFRSRPLDRERNGTTPNKLSLYLKEEALKCFFQIHDEMNANNNFDFQCNCQIYRLREGSFIAAHFSCTGKKVRTKQLVKTN